MKPLRTALMGLWLASMAFAVDIDGPSEVEPQTTVKLKAKGLLPKTGIVWKVEPIDGQDVKKIEWLSGTGRKTPDQHWIGPLGRYKITLETLRIVDGTPDWDKVEKVITLGKAGPVPPGPTPPDPPGPTPGPAPIAGDGLRVLMVYESSQVLPAAQESVLYRKAVRDYLREKAAKDTTNPDGAFRIWDKDVDASAESKSWQDALKRERKSVPWIVVSNPQKGGGFEGPLPETVEKMLELLRKYGS